MRGRKLIVDWIHTAEVLHARYKQERNTHIAKRLQALFLLRRVPRSTGCPANTRRSLVIRSNSALVAISSTHSRVYLKYKSDRSALRTRA